MTDVHIVGLSGSLRETSFSWTALGLAAEGARAAGAKVTLLTGSDLAFPHFNPATAYTKLPKVAADFIGLCQGASGFLWASPAYHGTISGLFKNALDYLDLLRAVQPPFLTGKPIGIVSVGSGTMAVVNAANTLVYVAHALRALPLPMMIPIGLADGIFSPEGECRDPVLHQRLFFLGSEVARAAMAYARDRQANS